MNYNLYQPQWRQQGSPEEGQQRQEEPMIKRRRRQGAGERGAGNPDIAEHMRADELDFAMKAFGTLAPHTKPMDGDADEYFGGLTTAWMKRALQRFPELVDEIKSLSDEKPIALLVEFDVGTDVTNKVQVAGTLDEDSWAVTTGFTRSTKRSNN